MLKKDVISKLTHLQQQLQPQCSTPYCTATGEPPQPFPTLYMCLHVRLEINEPRACGSVINI